MAKLIGIDIGHGEDTWEVKHGKGIRKDGKDYEEHHFNASVGLIVEKRLKQLGFNTLLAQPAFKTDVPLINRTNQYNKANCDLVISIHANAGTPKANGACAFYWHTSDKSKKLADITMKHYLETVKGVGKFGTGSIASVPHTWTDFHMVRETHMDAILVECGFMSNDNDFEYIFGAKKDTFIPQVTEAIVKAVCEYTGTKYSEQPKDAPVKVVKPSDVVKGNYKVKLGDTMYSIARDAGISLRDLQIANPDVKPATLKAGSYIVVPAKKAEAPKGDQKTDSIVKYLDSIKVDSSFPNRTKLATKYGISKYAGTAEQNLLLLKKMRGH